MDNVAIKGEVFVAPGCCNSRGVKKVGIFINRPWSNNLLFKSGDAHDVYFNLVPVDSNILEYYPGFGDKLLIKLSMVYGPNQQVFNFPDSIVSLDDASSTPACVVSK